MTEQQLVGLGFLICVMVAAGAWTQVFHRKGRAVGVIREIVTRRGTDSDYSSVPRITFQAGGNDYSFLPSTVLAGDARESRVGQKVMVAYNLQNPNDADVASPVRMYAGPVIVTGLAVIAGVWFVRTL